MAESTNGAQESATSEKQVDVLTEEFRVKGDEIVARIKEIIREGNARRIVIRSEQGKTLVEFPLTIGLIGALLLPTWAAIGAIAALVTDCVILVERVEG
ncbi:MAG TPA: DUF4342 domain-containing protein [Ardenticatenaceae bacterium]|nr:DUF4342 domain-containing protein [Ardenticatenaceae bacterium]